jgi:hypothetical protein
MNTLPTAYLGSTRRYIGAVDPSNPRLVAAAQALYDDLAGNGCRQASLPVVSDFQSAWIAAGGTLPQDTGGRSPIDGFYGDHTAAALRQLYPDADPGCVGTTGGGGSAPPRPTPLTVLPATNWLSLSSISTTMALHPWWTAIFLGVAVAATYVNWKKTKRRGGGRRKVRRPTRRRARARRVVRRGRRRRNPSEKRTSFRTARDYPAKYRLHWGGRGGHFNLEFSSRRKAIQWAIQNKGRNTRDPLLQQNLAARGTEKWNTIGRINLDDGTVIYKSFAMHRRESRR